MIMGDLQDGAIAFDNRTVGLVDRYLSELNPNVVVTHYPQKSGTGHQDHDALASAVVAAVRRSQTVRTLLYAEPPTQAWDFTPDIFVDITDHFEAKRQAVELHASEKGKAYMLLDPLETRAKWWSFQAYVEGYENKRFEAFQLVKMTW